MQELIAEAITTTQLSEIQALSDEFEQLIEQLHAQHLDNNIVHEDKLHSLQQISQTILHSDAHLIEELLANEAEVEALGRKVFKNHTKKLQQAVTFSEQYPMEKTQRRTIREVVFNLTEPEILKDIGFVQYYSKEMLYQRRNQTYLDKWLNALQRLKDGLQNRPHNLSAEQISAVVTEIDAYEKTVKLMGKIVIEARLIEAQEQKDLKTLQTILEANEDTRRMATAKIVAASEELVAHTRLIQIAFGGMMVFLAFALSTIISRSVSRSISKLQRGVEQIQNGDLGVKINVDLDQEFRNLAAAFNRMTDELQAAHQSLDQHNRNLENTVSERTAALQDAMSEIEDKKNMMEDLATKLAKYLSPQVYNSIFTGEKDVKVETHRKKLTIFFSDIKGFTELTDRMESEQLATILNDYLNEMSIIALRHGGTIDKFIGDALMIFFGDPTSKGEKNDALACVSMALEMRDRMEQLRDRWSEQGLGKSLRIRMGINSGYCTVGNFGSEDRLDYTIIGGQVNLASRLESLAAADQILISHETYLLIREAIHCTEGEEVKVKGIAYPIQTYQVVDRHEDLANASTQFEETFEGFHLQVDLNPGNKQKVLQSLRDALQALE